MKLDLEKGLSQLFSGISSNKAVISIKKTKVILKVLDILISNGLILSYRNDVEKGSLCVVPRHNYSNCISKLYVLPKNSYFSLSYKSLLKYVLHKGTCIVLLYNPWFGIVSHQVALKKKVGGRVICVIYF